jgi:hypothetical protein
VAAAGHGWLDVVNYFHIESTLEVRVVTARSQPAETLDRLSTLQARTLADAYGWTWILWFFWAAVYIGSVPVFLWAPGWGITLYWVLVLPPAVAATMLATRRLPRRTGVVPHDDRLSMLGGAALILVGFTIGPVTPLGPAISVAFALAAFGWVWPRRLAVSVALGLVSAAVVLVVVLDERAAAAAIAVVYATAFVAYALYERSRLRSWL